MLGFPVLTMLLTVDWVLDWVVNWVVDWFDFFVSDFMFTEFVDVLSPMILALTCFCGS